MLQLAPGRRVLAAVSLIAAAALLVEVTLIRLLSVALWYPFAFVGIATAMLGFGGAAVAVSLSTRLRSLPVQPTLRWAAVAFCLTTGLGYPVWNALPVAPMSLGQDATQVLWTGSLLLVITLPFACAGLFISRVFAAWPRAAPRLYAADLVGATGGVLAYVILLPVVGAPGALMLAGGIGALAGLLLYDGSVHGRLAVVLLIAATFGAATETERLLPLRITKNKLLGTAQARELPRGSIWTLSSAIDVIDPGGHADPVVVIDGGTAMTQVPRATKSRRPPPPRGLRALAYLVAPKGTTLVIGSGGGVEVRAALGAGVERILALEIDGAINDLVRGRLGPVLGGLFARPAVELHTAEARSFLASHDERFDVIVAFHTISNAASSTGAMSLAESYLLTVEAMELLLSRLSDDGVLVMSRPEPQLGRLAATVAAAWPFASDLHGHVAVVTQSESRPDFLAAMLVSKRPLTRRQVEAIRGETPGRVAYLPDGSGDTHDWFSAALASNRPEAAARAREARAALGYPAASLEPVTDDRPFFNLYTPWTEIGVDDVIAVLSSGASSRVRLEDLPVAQVAILLLLLEALLLAFIFVIPPAILLRRSGLAPGRALTTALYFAALGYAFITVEVVLIQKLTRIVGEPAWSMVAVLAVLLASSGLGSMLFAGRLDWSPTRASLAAAAAGAYAALIVPRLVDGAAGLPFAARLVAVVLMVAPAGVMMGIPFSAGLKRLDRDDLVAWAWALGSLLSVGGSIAALIIGSSIGFTLTALVSAAVYGGAAAVGRRLA
jgi:spermidine synthase